MAPQRSATPMSVAAHSLHEQSDPYVIIELRSARWCATSPRLGELFPLEVETL
jgi:hypothetical protein